MCLFRYYLNGALCGGLCCSVTHGGMCPVDVVKTRIQLDPVKYNKGLIGGFRQIIQAEGAGAHPPRTCCKLHRSSLHLRTHQHPSN